MTLELLGISWEYLLLGVGIVIALYILYKLLKFAVKWAVIIGVLAWFIIYIIENCDPQQIAIGFFLIVMTVGVCLAVLANSGRKGDVRDRAYQFEMGRKSAEEHYKRTREGRDGGFI